MKNQNVRSKTANILQIFYKSFKIYINKFPINCENSVQVNLDIEKLWLFITKQVTNKGNLSTIKIIKHFRLTVFKYTAGENVPRMEFLKVNKYGLPKAFGQMLTKHIENRNPEVIRSILTLLQVSFVLEGYGQPNYDSITNEYSGSDEALSQICNWVEINYKKVVKVKPTTFWDSPHHTSKAGPLGPALTHCIYELELLSDEHLTALKTLGGPRFTMWLENCYAERGNLIKHQEIRLLSKGVQENRDKTLRRLVLLKHPEGKLRPIAILDYWSQTVLKPLHEWAFACLASLRCDMTFNQGNVIKHFSENDGPFYSFDLKSATDRFPIKLQESFLKGILGDKRVAAWKFLLVSKPFTVEHNRIKNEVSYKTGQCMGAYSSWGIFSLCHHLLVQYCAEKAGKKLPFEFYAILGDDIVIACKDVALEYRKVIESIGVKIDDAKSLVSKDSFEFAKRYIHNKQELTAFPLAAIVANRNNPRAIWSTLLTARERGYSINSECTPGFVVEFQKAFCKTFRQTEKLIKTLEALWLLNNITTREDDRLAWCLNTLFNLYNVSIPCSTNLWRIRDLFLSRIGEYLVEFQTVQLDTLYKESMTTTLRLGALTILNTDGSIDLAATQVRPDIDISRIPLVWIGKLLAIRGKQEMDKLMIDADRGDWSAFLRSYPPTGNLSKIISRQPNMNSLAVNSAKMKHIVRRFKQDNDSISQALAEENTIENE